MPTQFQILPQRNLVYIRHVGRLTLNDANDSFSRFMQHPDQAAGQLHLADFSGVTWYEKDYLSFMRFQARIASELTGPSPCALLVIYGPENPGRELSMALLRSWEGLDQVEIRLAGSEEEALDILGQPERRFSALFDLDVDAEAER